MICLVENASLFWMRREHLLFLIPGFRKLFYCVHWLRAYKSPWRDYDPIQLAINSFAQIFFVKV